MSSILFDKKDFDNYKRWGSAVGRKQFYVIYARLYAPDALEQASNYLGKSIWELLEDYNYRFVEIIKAVYGVDLETIGVEQFIVFAIKTNLIYVDYFEGETLPTYAKKKLYMIASRVLEYLNGYSSDYSY